MDDAQEKSSDAQDTLTNTSKDVVGQSSEPGRDGGETQARPPKILSVFALVSFLGLVLLAVVMTSVVAVPVAIRDAAFSPIDSYYYMTKAKQIIDCPLQDCRMLEDLRPQLNDRIEDNQEADLTRTHVLQRMYYMYHTTHSLFLAGLHKIGVEWEDGLNALAVAGVVILCIGMIQFLSAQWGMRAAGLAALLLVPQSYPGFHGIHWIVPSNMALALSLPLWAYILWRFGRPQAESYRQPTLSTVVILTLSVLVIVWMHTIGKAYAGIAIGLFAILILFRPFVENRFRLSPLPDAWRNPIPWLACILAGIAWLTPWIAGALFERPMFDGSAFLRPPDWDYIAGTLANLEAAYDVVHEAFFDWDGLLIVILAGYGFFHVPKDRRWIVYSSAFMILLFVGVALLHNLPDYPGEAFHRAYIMLFVMLAGGFGAGVWHLLKTDGGKPVRCTVIVIGFTLVIGSQIQKGYSKVLGEAVVMSTTSYAKLDRDQPDRLKAMLDDGERIAFADQMTLYFFSLYGGMDVPAALSDRFQDTDGMGWARYERDIAIVTAPMPLFRGIIPIFSNNALVIDLEENETRVDTIALRLFNDLNRPYRLDISGTALEISPDSEEWITIDLTRIPPERGRIVLRKEEGIRLWLTGIRLDPDQETRWPWRNPVSLTYIPPEDAKPDRHGDLPEVETVSTSMAEMLPDDCTGVEVIEDHTSIVAMRVRCEE